MEVLRKTNCKNCGKENTVDVHITENDEEISVLVKDCKECGFRNNLSDLFSV